MMNTTRPPKAFATIGYRRLQVTLWLARYVAARLDDDFLRAELGRDLGLQPLDVILFVLSFSESDDPAFRWEELEHIVTAEDLITTVSGWLAEYDHGARVARRARRMWRPKFARQAHH